MAVFVVDRRHQPLMPCSEKRARLLLARRRAVVHRRVPFTLRLKDRTRDTSQVQPVALKLDPGSKITGMALVRVEQQQEGEVHHALLPAGESLASRRAGPSGVAAAGRLSAVAQEREPAAPLASLPESQTKRRVAPAFLAFPHRQCVGLGPPEPSMDPISRIEVERVKFDTHLLHTPEVAGAAYQRGELFGWEVRAYVLEKFGHRCAYCHTEQGPFELEHIRPRSRGGSNRVSNLALACHECNVAKGNLTAAEWGHPEVEAQAKARLVDAAAMNASRYALVEALQTLGLPLGTWSGGRIRWNRERFGIEKDHCLDALCVGELAGVERPAARILVIRAHGRGSYQRTNVDGSGFPRGSLSRPKRIRGFSTGDLVRAVVPPPLKTAGEQIGRVAVRASGSFRAGKVDGINAKYVSLLQRTDGYEYGQV